MKTFNLVTLVAVSLVLVAGRRLPYRNSEDDHPQKFIKLRQFEDGNSHKDVLIR